METGKKTGEKKKSEGLGRPEKGAPPALRGGVWIEGVTPPVYFEGEMAVIPLTSLAGGDKDKNFWPGRGVMANGFPPL